ncbi:sterile alpha motif domain-containing protein 3-like [Epinephelus lanceolatus]
MQGHSSATSTIKTPAGKDGDALGHTFVIASGFEDGYSVELHITKIKEECKKAHPNMDMLKDKMKKTFAEREHFIQSHSTSDVLQEFPALQHISIIFSEMEHIHKVDVDKLLLEGFGRAADKIIAVVRRGNLGEDILRYQSTLSQDCVETQSYLFEVFQINLAITAIKLIQVFFNLGLKVSAAMLLLPHLFNEDSYRLYAIDKVVKAPTPALLVSGNPFNADSDISLRLDGVKITKPDDITMGVGALFAVYFIFGVRFAEKLRKYLIFLQRCMIGSKSNEKVLAGVIKMANFLF